MEHKARNRLAIMAALAMLSTGFSHAANAGGVPLLPRRPAEQHPGLDLRPPSHFVVAESAGRTSNMFPSAAHRETLEGTREFSLPNIGTGRTPGRLEELARKVHREGLPIARLWENKSALVSLGLSPKGKPGLWITQKVP